MKNEPKKYKLNIFGESYTLVSDEAESHVTAAAQVVDDLMTTMAKSFGSQDGKKLAVLVALQLSSQLLQAKSQMTHYKSEKERLAAVVDQGLALCSLS